MVEHPEGVSVMLILIAKSQLLEPIAVANDGIPNKIAIVC